MFTENRDDLVWQHEPDIQNFVSYLIDDMIAINGLYLQLAKKALIKSVYPDFWILTYRGIPIGKYSHQCYFLMQLIV